MMQSQIRRHKEGAYDLVVHGITHVDSSNACYSLFATRSDGDRTETIIEIGADSGFLGSTDQTIYLEIKGSFERDEFMTAMESILRHLKTLEPGEIYYKGMENKTGEEFVTRRNVLYAEHNGDMP